MIIIEQGEVRIDLDGGCAWIDPNYDHERFLGEAFIVRRSHPAVIDGALIASAERPHVWEHGRLEGGRLVDLHFGGESVPAGAIRAAEAELARGEKTT